MKSGNKGFTLIELLVVIAIIGILSSVVLASLNTARDKGADAAIKANINGVRAQAEIVYDAAPGDYDDVCEDPNVGAAVTAADDANGAGAVNCYDSTTSGIEGWAIVAGLKADTTQSYCVDYKGNATVGVVDTDILADVDGDCDSNDVVE